MIYRYTSSVATQGSGGAGTAEPAFRGGGWPLKSSLPRHAEMCKADPAVVNHSLKYIFEETAEIELGGYSHSHADVSRVIFF